MKLRLPSRKRKRTGPARTPPEEFVRPDGFRELTDDELHWIGSVQTCPYCKGDLYAGPQGGMCTNLLCKTEGCWSRFNYCVFTGQYVGQDQHF